MNKSASLTAGVCSLCITASLVAVPPQASAAELPAIGHRTVSMVDQPYELTASSQIDNLLLVAGIPFNNLNTTIENTTASESRIRDTDMAAEMTNFTRTQVLTQAGTAMLAQANQSTQSILKLLG